MVFSSVTFVFCFLPIVLIVYYFVQGKARNIWLLFASLLFYAWGGISFLPVMLFSILLNYIGGRAISGFQRRNMPVAKKACFALALGANLLLLGYWKYANFLVGIVEQAGGITIEMDEIMLPIGISFFTFQGMSYVIDVYRGDVAEQKNILNLGLFIALFPQLIAGPIVRYTDINEQIAVRAHSVEKFMDGVRRFIVGLAKKAIIANSVGVVADDIFARNPWQNTVSIAWIGALCYTLQIYYDFSGYSDMAIGLGRMFGFDLLENFNYPYIARSITEFWKRWHMSLGRWFRDYVYIPLGGNRVSTKRWIFNTFIVWLLTGMWHGADWTYICWGLLFFCLLMFEKASGLPGKLGRFSHIYTLFIVMISMALFRSPSLSYAGEYIRSMFGLLPLRQVGYSWQWYLDRYHIFIIVAACIASTPIGVRAAAFLQGRLKRGAYILCIDILSFALFGVTILFVMTATYNPFIYFQF